MRFKNLNSHRRSPKFGWQVSRKSVLKVTGIFLLLLIVIGGLFLSKTNPFQIKKIVFTTPVSCIPNSEIERLIAPKTQSFFTPDFVSLEKKIVDQNPCLKFISIKKKFPNTLEISTIPRQKVATLTLFASILNNQFKTLDASSSSAPAQPVDLTPNLKTATETGVFVVDQDGFIFDKALGDQNLPNINIFDENLAIGRKLDNDLIGKTGVITKKLQELMIPEKAINIRGESIYIDSDPIIILALNKDLQRQLVTLQLILQKAKIESGESSSLKQIQKIDLRFDKSVVVYTNKKQ